MSTKDWQPVVQITSPKIVAANKAFVAAAEHLQATIREEHPDAVLGCYRWQASILKSSMAAPKVSVAARKVNGKAATSVDAATVAAVVAALQASGLIR